MRHLLPIALLFLAACGASDPKSLANEGHAALGKGDSKTALAKFDAALEGLDRKSPDYFRPALGRCVALAHIDGAASKAAFLDLAAKVPDMVGENDYSLVCSALIQGGFTLQAVEVMDAGNKRFKGSKTMQDTLTAVMAAAKRDKTPEALRKLESLGYAGG